MPVGESLDLPVAPGDADPVARIERKGPGHYVVLATAASPALRVNGNQTQRFRLQSDDRIDIGDTPFRFRSRPPTLAPQPPMTTATCRTCRHAFEAHDLVAYRGHPTCRPCRASLVQRRTRRRTALLAGGACTVVLALGLAFLVGRSTGKSPADETPTSVDADASSASRDSPTARLSSAEIVRRSEDSVGLLTDGRGVGTGFLIAKNVLATNAHVIEDAFVAELALYFPSIRSKRYDVHEVLYEDLERDLCLLRVTAPGKPLRLSPVRHLRRGEDVVIIGNPGLGDELVLENAVTSGLLSAETPGGWQSLPSGECFGESGQQRRPRTRLPG